MAIRIKSVVGAGGGVAVEAVSSCMRLKTGDRRTRAQAK